MEIFLDNSNLASLLKKTSRQSFALSRLCEHEKEESAESGKMQCKWKRNIESLRGHEAEGRGEHLFAFLAEFNLNNFMLSAAEWIMSNHNTSNA